MKVKCIENNGICYLTISKTYEVIDYNYYDYWIIDDNNHKD
jgi:hypothetical protein